MKTRDEILNLLTVLISEMFEIPSASVLPNSSLAQDLDIDSIDAVDLMVKLREMTGKRIQPEDFKSARTVQDVVEIIHSIYNS